MKKLLSIFIVLMLCACANTLAWDDVKQQYLESERNFKDYPQSVTKDDYLNLFDQIEANIDSLNAGIKKDDTHTADNLYLLAVKLNSFGSIVNSINARQVQDLAEKTKQLVEAAYNKDSNFDELKTSLKEEYEAAKQWDDSIWSSLVKKETISWSSVEEQYNTLAEETIENMPSRKKVSELELEELNNIIGAKYQNIKDGVTQDNEQDAQEIYLAGLQLSEYTNEIEGEIPEKVNDFGKQAMQYVIECYDGPITLENYNFLNLVEETQKWPLSLWNELTALLKR